MILSKPDILEYLQSRKLEIDPPVAIGSVAQVSIDLRVGRRFTVFKDPPEYLPAIHVDPSLWGSADLWQHYEQDTFRLNPSQFVLAHTLERIRIPNDLVGLVEGRSSWARVGVTIHVTAPKIDPGFDAQITLEMADFGRVPVDLRAEIDQPARRGHFSGPDKADSPPQGQASKKTRIERTTMSQLVPSSLWRIPQQLVI